MKGHIEMTQNQADEDDLILIFGPQDLSFDKLFAKTLREALLESSSLHWIVQALLELPKHWKSLESSIPGLKDSAGENLLLALVDWVRLGDLPDESYPLPSLLLTPLVVTLQLMQYSSFVKQLYPELSPSEKIPYLGRRRAETVGLCTGLLSAAAVASSESLQELANYGAVAIRLAMALGAVADAGDKHTASTQGRWQSFAVTWHSADGGVEFAKAMDACPEVSSR